MLQLKTLHAATKIRCSQINIFLKGNHIQGMGWGKVPERWARARAEQASFTCPSYRYLLFYLPYNHIPFSSTFLQFACGAPPLPSPNQLRLMAPTRHISFKDWYVTWTSSILVTVTVSGIGTWPRWVLEKQILGLLDDWGGGRDKGTSCISIMCQ